MAQPCTVPRERSSDEPMRCQGGLASSDQRLSWSPRRTMTSFVEFLDALPRVDAAAYPIQSAASTWATYETATNPSFVPPPLQTYESSVAPDPTVLILTASGAVGKST